MTDQPGFQPLPSSQPPGLVARLIAFVLSLALLVAGFMFSLVALAAIVVVGIGFAGWFWWKTRALRRQLRDAHADLRTGMQDAKRGPTDNDIIEGEFVREASAPPERLPH